MRILCLARAAIGGAAIVFWAGCGGPQPIGAPGTLPPTSYLPARSALPTRLHASNEKVLFSFNLTDGAFPKSGLLNVKGTLYGTTPSGGAYGTTHYADGTVFSVTRAGTETVLHSFGSGTDGLYPSSSLIDVNGTLYGTTEAGGTYGNGTVFSITTAGVEKVLYSFGNGNDGAFPSGALLNVNGTLYGTTIYGGKYGGSSGYGTVFSLTRAGKERVLHSFASGADGVQPLGCLLNVNEKLYGTTSYGGATYSGTVFSITTAGKEKVVHSFGSGSDGTIPSAGLIDANGTLYGTTLSGGSYRSGCFGNGCGTVFSMATDGKEDVLHSFGSANDGADPNGNLLNMNGSLYGTTNQGGSGCNGYGCGTAFSISTAGKEKVIHTFGSGTDGIYPFAGLINARGTFYGTTFYGGTYGQGKHSMPPGYGTVFALNP